MSKIHDEKNEQKSNLKQIPFMSERQLVNYVKKQTLTEANWDAQGEKVEEQTLDFFTYFMKRKEKIVRFVINKFREIHGLKQFKLIGRNCINKV
jgi:hypothetical protein